MSEENIIMSSKRYVLYGIYKFLKIIGYRKFSAQRFRSMNIILFHRINDYSKDSLTISTKRFDTMMQMLYREYKVVSLGEMVNVLRKGEDINPKAVAITFDDGYMDNYTFAAPILGKYSLPACFFITSGYIGTTRVFPWDKESGKFFALMNWDHVRSLVDRGFEIGAHTIDHVDLGTEPLNSAKYQIVSSKKEIEQNIGSEVRYFAYPFGSRKNIRQEIRDMVKEAGFLCCCSGYGGKVTQESDPYDLPRISTYANCIDMRMELDNFMTYYDGEMSINVPYLDAMAKLLPKHNHPSFR